MDIREIKKLVRERGIFPKTVLNRMRRGKTLEEALAMGPQRKYSPPYRVGMDDHIVVDSEKYKSAFGIDDGEER